MKSLVEGECSRPNTLVELSRTAGQTNARLPSNVQSSLLPSFSSTGDVLACEYLTELSRSTAAPSTFSMQELAKQLPEHSTRLAKQWTDEHLSRQSTTLPDSQSMTQHWLDEYIPSTSKQLGSWADKQSHKQTSTTGDSDSLARVWSSDYLESFDQRSSQGPVNDQRVDDIASAWVNEFLQGKDQSAVNLDDDLFEYMENGWEALRNEASEVDMKMPSLTEYVMSSANPFLNKTNSVECGKSAWMNGDLANAVLHFEAAVQHNPQDSQAWCLLGLSQAENEHDLSAIAAFKKSLEIDPRNMEASLGLSVSYANESLENEAVAQLERWLSVNPVYGRFEPTLRSADNAMPFLDQAFFAQVEERFLSAAQNQPSGGDATLQNAIGILYNIGGNYERAIDSLKTAIAIEPQDARLWNRLGATLANGDRSVEAIFAYKQALSLFPAYVRARYNLGISCMHLDSYTDAIQHFVSALELQEQSSSSRANSGSSSIWQTLRSAVIRSGLVEYNQLLTAVDTRDLSAFQSIVRAGRW